MENRTKLPSPDKLHRHAVESLAHRYIPEPPPAEVDAQKLSDELQVCKIELELQNEEMQRARMEQEASLSLYRDLFDLAPIAYCTLDDEGRILQANFYAATLLGVTREALVKRPIQHFIANEDRETFNHYSHQLNSTAGLHTCDLRMIKGGGTPFWVRLRSLRNSIGNDEHGYRITFGDISESKRMEE